MIINIKNNINNANSNTMSNISKPINNTIINIVRECASGAGLLHPDAFSSHSLRRGFASWADSNGWSLKELMEYVGWKDPKTALRYIGSSHKIQQHFIEQLK